MKKITIKEIARIGIMAAAYVASAFLQVPIPTAIDSTRSFIEHRFILGLPMEAVILTTTQKAVVPSVNAIVACLAAFPLDWPCAL